MANLDEKSTPVSDTLKGIWTDWPETRWDMANVLLEGPSIRGFNPTELLIGPVIAVNHALSLPAPVDFWATTDNPARLWAWSEPHRRENLRYFTTDQNVGVFSELLPEHYTDVYSQPFTEMWKDDGKPIILPTIIPVLSWLLLVGVKYVRLFGCDMWGSNSPLHSSEPWSEEDPNHSARWKVERTLLSHAMREYRLRGARIERWPKEARCRNQSPSRTRSARTSS